MNRRYNCDKVLSMPEESINIFISNIYTFAIFLGVFILIFLVLFIISRFLNNKITKFYQHDNRVNLTNTKDIRKLRNYSEHIKIPKLFQLKKDFNILKTLFVIGIIFIFSLFFLILIILSFHFTESFKIDGGLYIIILILFLTIVFTIYIVKSRFIR